jgi:hypothetical protein
VANQSRAFVIQKSTRIAPTKELYEGRRNTPKSCLVCFISRKRVPDMGPRRWNNEEMKFSASWLSPSVKISGHAKNLRQPRLIPKIHVCLLCVRDNSIIRLPYSRQEKDYLASAIISICRASLSPAAMRYGAFSPHSASQT